MIFAKIAQLLKYGKGLFDQGTIWGLSDGQINRLLSLRSNRDWPVFLELVDRVVNIKGEGLLSVDASNVDFQRGYIAGLRAAPALVDLAIAQKENKDVRQQRADERAEPRDTRASSLYATPAWDQRTGLG